MNALNVQALLCKIILFTSFTAASADTQPFPIADLKSGRHVVMMRHALAPGTGDPSNFSLRDCTTQRNLNDTGRAQARKLGELFRSQGITDALVYSSQWCRCLETAKLLGLGEVKELPALNSMYQRPETREKNIAGMEAFFKELGTQTEKPVILVTHQVTIRAITGEWTSSGASKVLELNGTEQPELVGVIAGE